VDATIAPTPNRRTAAVAAALLLALAIFAVALLWAKWLPYAAKTSTVSSSHTWTGSDILSVGGVSAGDAPTWHAATSFFSSYVQSIWKALVAALLIGSAVQALVPRGWAARLINRNNDWSSAAVGGALGTPSMMCTCCTAPVAASLRREGVGVAGAVAYWLANPLLNPAVIAFLAFVAPWQWTVTRLVVGVTLVVAGSVLVARIAPRDVDVPTEEPERLDAQWLARAPLRFGTAVTRLVLFLVPEYFVVVLLLGAFRGWLFPLGADTDQRLGLLVVLVAAVVGTLLVIPTAGEIPIVAGLAAAGLSLGGLGALLVTLPAASLPAMAMLSRRLGVRATLATAGVVMAGGVLAAGVLSALG